jgi:hypothetical protein
MTEEKLLADMEKVTISMNLLAKTTDLSFLAEAKSKPRDCQRVDESAEICIEINEKVLLPSGPIIRDTLGHFVQKVESIRKEYNER